MENSTPVDALAEVLMVRPMRGDLTVFESIAERTAALAKFADVVVVDAPVIYEKVAEALKYTKALEKEIDAAHDPGIKQKYKDHRDAVARKGEQAGPVLRIETTLKHKLGAYDAEQERLRLEKERKDSEAALKAEEDRRLAEAAALDNLARATGDESYAAEAEAIIQAPIEAPAVTVASTTPVVSGVSYSERWSAVVTDKKRLVQFVAANPDYLNLLDVNQPAINALARGLKSAMKIPGLQAKSDRTVSSRAS